jgi:hypothetical protein
LPSWELRLLTPQHLAEDVPAFEAAARQELAAPLRLDAVDELSWFFKQQLSVEAGAAPEDCARFARAHRQFHAPRYRTLYRLWKKEGNRLLHGTVSPVLEDALARGRGRVTTEVLTCRYQHLSSLVGSA